MTVKELTQKLSKLDPDLPVYFYSEMEECDGGVNSVRTVRQYVRDHYCQGDSLVKEYLTENGGKAVVLRCD